eukprot:365007-Chlamydomonas_euryale.AAC.2
MTSPSRSPRRGCCPRRLPVAASPLAHAVSGSSLAALDGGIGATSASPLRSGSGSREYQRETAAEIVAQLRAQQQAGGCAAQLGVVRHGWGMVDGEGVEAQQRAGRCAAQLGMVRHGWGMVEGGGVKGQ